MEGDRRHRLAVVDCGTNTFTLHIARFDAGGWKSVFRQRRFVRLGHDSFRTGRLSPLRMRRGLDVLSSFRETALNFGVTHARAIGCSALRDAANGNEFVRRADEQGWAIEVIDGAQEAEWIQRGVADTVPQDVLGTDAALTLDIGSGTGRPSTAGSASTSGWRG
jgi:exopolyphosphatase/guanosine-5'-triphosphate,3'-diphosphate pyrophosphatase